MEYDAVDKVLRDANRGMCATFAGFTRKTGAYSTDMQLRWQRTLVGTVTEYMHSLLLLIHAPASILGVIQSAACAQRTLVFRCRGKRDKRKNLSKFDGVLQLQFRLRNLK